MNSPLNNVHHRHDDYAPRARVVLIALIALLPVAVIAGRVTAPGRATIRQVEATPVPRALPDDVQTFHDASNEVTCWRTAGLATGGGYETGSGLSCLPDQWLAGARAQGGE